MWIHQTGDLYECSECGLIEHVKPLWTRCPICGEPGKAETIDYQQTDPYVAAQPEPLTDTEQRIFLVAMGTEEKVCKQVDEECRDCREPHEDSLVMTCHEIIRKVKDALWT